MKYPYAPGHHGEDTSVATAKAVTGRAKTDREMCLETFRHYGPMTADECAARLGWSDVYRARRRVTELKQQNKLVDTNATRNTKSGNPAQVLRAAEGEIQQDLPL